MQESEMVISGNQETLETCSSISFMVQVRDLRHREMKGFAQSHTVEDCEQNPKLLFPDSHISSAWYLIHELGRKYGNHMDLLSC